MKFITWARSGGLDVVGAVTRTQALPPGLLGSHIQFLQGPAGNGDEGSRLDGVCGALENRVTVEKGGSDPAVD